MDKLEILLIVAVVEVGNLRNFNLEDLSTLWAALTVCMDDEYFFATFEEDQKEAIKKALRNIEDELKRRGSKPLNFFKMMQENPAQVEFYLKQFDLEKLMDLANSLQEFANAQIVADFLKLVNRQIYRLIPVA